MFVPELKRPVANARSRFGNHSATTLIAAGKVARFAEAEREARHDEPGDRRRVGQADEREDAPPPPVRTRAPRRAPSRQGSR